jgi:hypothetical protein
MLLRQAPRAWSSQKKSRYGVENDCDKRFVLLVLLVQLHAKFELL